MHTIANVAAMCAIVTIMIAQKHFSSLIDMRTLLDRKNISSRTNGQVAARRVTGLIIKRLWINVASAKWMSRIVTLLKEIGTIKRFYSVYDVYYGLLHFIQPSVITKCGFIPEKRS